MTLAAPSNNTHVIYAERWLELTKKPEYSDIAAWIASIKEHPILKSFFSYSPYLSNLALSFPRIIHAVLSADADAHINTLIGSLSKTSSDIDDKEFKKLLRTIKNQMALLVATADVMGIWQLSQITSALSRLAEESLQAVLNRLLTIAHQRGEIALKHLENPSKESGIIILGMGKLGGHELNYSSDIDLIVFFEKNTLGYKGRHNEQHFMNRLAQDLVQFMQERTAEGYVFRTDLRLRPDPASTPPAINTEAAYYYYESVGQNWERAAMIKARPVAGDIEAGKRFITGLAPFMWRRSLDFASINDIHSIKRQMDTRQNRNITLKGHNVKLGMGGIREIEFFVQIHQLIWGGRELTLRTQPTCATLNAMLEFGLIDEPRHHTLYSAYEFLRKLEHRLQMVSDEQTHTMPTSDTEIVNIALFMDYPNVAAFESDFLKHTKSVHQIYASSFKNADKLGDEGNLVFTGVTHDPETLQTLRNMGYAQPETVSEIVMGWHHGSCRSTRTKRARELLTELMPVILKRLAETANPDAALLKFHDFLKNLPAGVQLFSLFTIHPQLLGLIADILGSAPTLAEHLSKSPHLLDLVLYDDFYEPLPDHQVLSAQLTELLKTARDYEESMERLRQFRGEKQFQAGVHFLKHMVGAAEVGMFLSDLAEVTIERAVALAMEEFAQKYGKLDGSKFAVLALGKLGSREMTFSSDIDLIFVYDSPDDNIVSDGEKGFSASVYYNRFTQRLLSAITLMARDGRLYEVDTRLRPSGSKGLLAVSTEALHQYFEESAWTFEYMALTKARPIFGDAKIREELSHFITTQIGKPRDKEKLKKHVIDMRERVEKEFGTKNPWDIKYIRGGLLDIDFIAQYLLLFHAQTMKPPYPGRASEIIKWLSKADLIPPNLAEILLSSEYFLSQIFHMLRLCATEGFNEEEAPAGLKKLLCETVQAEEFEGLKEHLLAIEEHVYSHYISIIGSSN